MARKWMAILGILVMGVMLTSNIALAERIRCTGGVCRGTQQADVMSGTFGADQIFSEAGDDEITARGGNDRLNGGSGNDLIFGEEGNDRIDGGTGADRIVGGDGVDILSGGSNSDTIDSAFGEGLGPLADTVDCGSGFDTVTADRLDKVSSNCEQVTRV
jgi:hypothetical protein